MIIDKQNGFDYALGSVVKHARSGRPQKCVGGTREIIGCFSLLLESNFQRFLPDFVSRINSGDFSVE